jgi:hypothetical protein
MILRLSCPCGFANYLSNSLRSLRERVVDRDGRTIRMDINMGELKTPLGYSYSDADMRAVRNAMPECVARGEGREFFEKVIDAMMIADKITKRLPPNSPEEAEQMREAMQLALLGGGGPD